MTKNQEPTIELGELSEREKNLIFAIRHKFRYANLKIITKDGQPFRLIEHERYHDLSTQGMDNTE